MYPPTLINLGETRAEDFMFKYNVKNKEDILCANHLPVENIVGFSLQQDVQVHTPTDHLTGGLHQPVNKTIRSVMMKRKDTNMHHLLLVSHPNTLGTPSRLRSSPSFPRRASMPFRISLGSTGPPAMSETEDPHGEHGQQAGSSLMGRKIPHEI